MSLSVSCRLLWGRMNSNSSPPTAGRLGSQVDPGLAASVVPLTGRDRTEASIQSEHRGLGPVRNLQLAQDVADVVARGDLYIPQPSGHQLKNLPLPSAQFGERESQAQASVG
jgi:hypothetical protein